MWKSPATLNEAVDTVRMFEINSKRFSFVSQSNNVASGHGVSPKCSRRGTLQNADNRQMRRKNVKCSKCGNKGHVRKQCTVKVCSASFHVVK